MERRKLGGAVAGALSIPLDVLAALLFGGAIVALQKINPDLGRRLQELIEGGAEKDVDLTAMEFWQVHQASAFASANPLEPTEGMSFGVPWADQGEKAMWEYPAGGPDVADLAKGLESHGVVWPWPVRTPPVTSVPGGGSDSLAYPWKGVGGPQAVPEPGMAGPVAPSVPVPGTAVATPELFTPTELFPAEPSDAAEPVRDLGSELVLSTAYGVEGLWGQAQRLSAKDPCNVLRQAVEAAQRYSNDAAMRAEARRMAAQIALSKNMQDSLSFVARYEQEFMRTHSRQQWVNKEVQLREAIRQHCGNGPTPAGAACPSCVAGEVNMRDPAVRVFGGSVVQANAWSVAAEYIRSVAGDSNLGEYAADRFQEYESGEPWVDVRDVVVEYLVSVFAPKMAELMAGGLSVREAYNAVAPAMWDAERAIAESGKLPKVVHVGAAVVGGAWSFSRGAYSIEELSRAVPDAILQWARKRAKAEGRELSKDDLKLPYKNRDGSVNRGGVESALKMIGHVKGVPADVLERARKELERARGPRKGD